MKETSRWQALIFIFIFMLVFALVFQSMPPLFGYIISSLGISHAQAGALMSLFGLPGIFISIPGGILADIYGSKLVGIGSLCIALAGSLLVGLGSSYSMLVVGRVIAGIGALTISVVAPQMLSRRFSQKDMGIAMGIFNMAMPLGTILTLNTFGLLGDRFGWRMPVLLTSFYALLVLLLFLFRYPSLPGEIEKNEGKSLDFREILSSIKGSGLSIWLIAIIWMLYNASSISYLTFGGDYYISVGYDESYAGFLTSLLMIGALLLSSVVGYLTDKFGKAEYFIIGGSISLAIALLLVPRTEISPLLIGALIGISASCIPAPVFALVPKVLPPEQMGLGYGILTSCLNLGVFVGPLLVGLLYDRSLNYISGFNLMGGLSMATAIVGFILKGINQTELGK